MLARPALDDMRGDAKKKLWDAVLVYDPDRLARRGTYQMLIMDELEEIGIPVLFVTTAAPKNIEDRMLYGMKGLFAEYERAKIAERTRLGKLRKAKDGHIIASEAPYGYTLIQRSGRPGDASFVETHYEINEIEAAVVRMIFSLIADERLTVRKVVKRLADRGILPRKSKRGVWNTSTLGTLLRNTTYIGEGHFGASYAVVPDRPFKTEKYKRIKKTSRRMRPKEEWIVIPTPAIVDKDLFERAQAQLRRNFEMSVRNKKNQYLLSGKIRCVCGRTRCGEGPQKGKHLYYRCTGRVHSFPLTATCQLRGINARIADGLVWSKLLELMRSKELIAAQIEQWKHDIGRNADHTGDIQKLEKELSKVKVEEDRYMRAYGAGLLEIEKMQEYVSPLRERRLTVQQQLVSMQQTVSKQVAAFPSEKEVANFSSAIDKAFDCLNFDQKRAIVIDVIDTVVGTPTELKVSGYLPVGQQNYVEHKTEHRHRRIAQCGQVHPF